MTTPRGYGPAVGEPPLVADPRRWGSLIGLVAGMVFVAINAPALSSVVAALGWATGVALVVAALVGHYLRPVSLGPLAPPHRLALVTYGGCVVGQVGLIVVGADALAAAGRADLRPALIAAVVGLHFLPFAWAFRERMFLHLGGAVALLGAAGLVAGGLGVPRAADASAVAAGLVMLGMSALYARGGYARSPVEQAAQ